MSVGITDVQIRYTNCSILTCFSLREIGVSRISSSTYEGSSSDPSLIEPLDLRETTLTFQNYTVQYTRDRDELRAAYLVDHVALWMPALVPHITIDLDKLLQDRTTATRAFGGKTRRVMKMAIHITIVFVVRILGTKESRT